jgi:Flagellar hook-length control protein FliK
MVSIPASTWSLILPALASRPAGIEGIPAAALQAAQAPPPFRPAPASFMEPPADAEAGEAGVANQVPGVDLLALFPTWRTLPAPGSPARELLPSGQFPPPAGKGVPPRIPVVPIEPPAIETLAPAADPTGAAPPAVAASGRAPAQEPTPVRLPPEIAPRTSQEIVAPPPQEIVDRLPPKIAETLPRKIVGPSPQQVFARQPSANGLVPKEVLAGAPAAAVVLRDAAADALPRPSLPQHEFATPASTSRPRLRLAASYPTQGAASQQAALAQGSEASAAGVLPERAAALDPGGAVGATARLAAGPEAGILSAATLPPTVQPGAPQISIAQQHLPEMVGSEEWAEAVAQRLSQLADSPHARANIRLNPPQLGPMQIEVHVDGDRAVVQLAVHHDATREALEQAMPRLRAQLEGSGFASIDVSVSRNPHRERPGNGSPYGDASLPPDDEPAPTLTASGRASVPRLLDAYA